MSAEGSPEHIEIPTLVASGVLYRGSVVLERCAQLVDLSAAIHPDNPDPFAQISSPQIRLGESHNNYGETTFATVTAILDSERLRRGYVISTYDVFDELAEEILANPTRPVRAYDNRHERKIRVFDTDPRGWLKQKWTGRRLTKATIALDTIERRVVDPRHNYVELTDIAKELIIPRIYHPKF